MAINEHLGAGECVIECPSSSIQGLQVSSYVQICAQTTLLQATLTSTLAASVCLSDGNTLAVSTFGCLAPSSILNNFGLTCFPTVMNSSASSTPSGGSSLTSSSVIKTTSTTALSISSTKGGNTETPTPASSPTIGLGISASGSTSPTSPAVSRSSNLSGGVSAAIGITCAIAGAIIASAIIWFFCLRHQKHRQKSDRSPIDKAESSSKSATELTYVFKNNENIIDNYLPQPAEENGIVIQMSKIRDKIKNHAQSYYHGHRVELPPSSLQGLQIIAEISGTSSMEIAELISDPRSRVIAIRIYLATLILSHFGIGKLENATLLPPEVSAFVPLLANIDMQDSGQVALASKWKLISGTLLKERYGQQDTALENISETNIKEIVARANTVLSVFERKSTSESITEKRLLNLEAIIRRAAKFAFLLFSQPSSWKFQWKDDSVSKDCLVVFPGLQQSVDDKGHVRTPPWILSKPEIVSSR